MPFIARGPTVRGAIMELNALESMEPGAEGPSSTVAAVCAKVVGQRATASAGSQMLMLVPPQQASMAPALRLLRLPTTSTKPAVVKAPSALKLDTVVLDRGAQAS